MSPGEVTAELARYSEFNLRRFWMAAYRALDERQWYVLEARYIHEREWTAIAKDLGLHERTVRRIGGEAMDLALKRYQETGDRS